jgi:hypothetical protein
MRLKNNLIPIQIHQAKLISQQIEAIKYYSLTVQAIPSDSRIRIMNIKPKYKPGIELSSGDYRILVEKNGYFPHEEIITIKDSNVIKQITLKNRINH